MPSLSAVREVGRVALVERARRPARRSGSRALMSISVARCARSPSRAARATGTFDERRIGVERARSANASFLASIMTCQASAEPRPMLLEVEALEHVEHLQRGDALAVRRQLVDVVAAVVHADRLDPVAGVRREVLVAQTTADAAHVRRRSCARWPPCRTRRAALRDQLVRSREVGIREDLTLHRRVAVDQIRVLCVVHFLERSPRFSKPEVAGPVIGDELGDRKTFTRVFDSRCKYLINRQFTEAVVQCKPAVDRTGHRHGQGSQRRNRIARAELRFQVGETASQRRPTRSVVAIELLRLGVPDDGEEVAADAATHRLHQSERGVRGDGRVDGTAASFQDVDRDLRRERLRRCRHAVPREHRCTRGKPRSAVTIAAAGRGGRQVVGKRRARPDDSSDRCGNAHGSVSGLNDQRTVKHARGRRNSRPTSRSGRAEHAATDDVGE